MSFILAGEQSKYTLILQAQDDIGCFDETTLNVQVSEWKYKRSIYVIIIIFCH